MDQEVVTELIQDDCTTERIKDELTKILEGDHRAKLLAQYNQLEQKLGGIGASQKTAQLIVKDLS
jgi:lipid-A-disaccharide synthase